ncbi:hypothetical protein, partial [Vibrio parahaemolyticus]|uniref:hypothetical protein n=1 Tax=Vibrio parahaemolyticus TaxID=670 RepID=UPI001A8E7F7A
VSVILLDSSGQALYASGRVPTGLRAQTGFADVGEWRVYGEPIGELYLPTLRSVRGPEESLDRFDHLLVIVWPLALLAALGLGYG